MLDIRQKSGQDSVYFLGSAKFSNEQAYLFRKFYAFWGSNNGDHQARICHSTTVAGVANTWGYGAMTNSYNDIMKSKAMFLIGGNPAEAHPVSLQHLLKAKEQNNAAMIVCDPRFTRTAAHATEYVRFRPGTDIALIWGLLWHIFENGWEDKEFIRKRVWGMDFVREEVKKWTPEETEAVTGVPGAQLRRVAKTLATNKPGTVIWCMGGTQHTVGNANVRAYCILQLALGNMGVAGGGTNIFRGHDNVQGATDFGVEPGTLPGYYGLAEGAWKHWARVWDVPYDWLLGRFKDKKLMEEAGIPLSRWADGVLEAKENVAAARHAEGGVLLGPCAELADARAGPQEGVREARHAGHHRPASDGQRRAARPHRRRLSAAGGNAVRDGWVGDGVQPLAAMAREGVRAVLRGQVRSRDHVSPGQEARLRQGDVQEHQGREERAGGGGHHPRVQQGGMWTIGYTGQSPERLKLHMANQHTFDKVTLKANGGPCDGDYYGLPWPCWGTAAMKHPGTPNLYDTSKPVADGGLNFRVNWGLTVKGQANDKWSKNDPVADSLLAVESYPVGAEIKDGHPPVTMGLLMKMGWDKDLTPEELATIQKIGGDKPENVAWTVDMSGGLQRVAIKHGIAPFGNGKARCVVWNFPDGVPLHREPLYTNRRDLLPKYATHPDRKLNRLPLLFEFDPEARRLQGLSDHPDVGSSGGVRGRRRGAALQPVAGRAAAEHVRGDQPRGRQQPRHQGRPAGVGRGRPRRPRSGSWRR